MKNVISVIFSLVVIFFMTISATFVPTAYACGQADQTAGCAVIVQGQEIQRLFEVQDVLADHEDQLATYRRQLQSERSRLEAERRQRREGDAALQRQIDALTAELGRIDALTAELEGVRTQVETNTASIGAIMRLLEDTITPRLLQLGERVRVLEREIRSLTERVDLIDQRVVSLEENAGAFRFLLLGSAGYLQVGALTGATASAGFGFDLRLSERGNLGLQIEILPAGLMADSDGARFHASGALNFLAGGESVRAVVGYRAGWVSNPTGGSAGQYHHGNVGVQLLLGEEARWSLTPAFHAGWGTSQVEGSRVGGRSVGLSLGVGVRF